MFTPRRTLLLLAGFMLFGVAYGAYSRLLGWLDGLPQLPAKLLKHRDDGTLPPQKGGDSPTQVKLARAFGSRSPETDYALYETQVEFRSGESSIVVAAGPVPANPNSNRIPLSPFSLAIFSKPKPAHLRRPGEVTEISTIHADKAILEFDRVIKNSNDMRNAKLVRLELVSDFGGTFEDPRRGMVHITNNQRSDDPNRYVVIRTPGPVFYRDAKAIAGTPATQGPDFWTDAPVEIVDRQNLPRPIGSPSPATVLGKSEELRNPETVSDIVAGRRSPPPTVTAIGFRLYLEPDPPPGQPRPKKNAGAPLQGVRRFEFLEQVVMNLWVDGNGQSFMGGAPTPDAQESGNQSLALTPPPAELAAIAGGVGPAAYTAKLQSRALLQVETRGPFAYDSERATARFDVVPLADPKLPNDVQVTKVSAREGKSSLFSQVLELELNGGPTSGARVANAPAMKRLHAWTITPGRYLTVTSQDESMQAYGQDLVHDPIAHRTVLVGPDVHVIRDRNVLKAGTPQRPATLTMEPGSTPGQPPRMTVLGPGRVDLVDSSSEGTFTAEWQTSLVQSKETINGREQDLFVFTDAARFEDRKTDYWLKGKVLKLWLEPQAPPPGKTARANAAPTLGGGQPRPARIQAIGDVKSHSAEYDVEQADQLNVFFEDVKAPVAVAVAPLPPPAAPAAPVAAAPAGDVRLAPPALPPKQPNPLPAEKKKEAEKPPMRIWAKDIQTRLHRVPAPAKGAPAKAGGQAAGGTKYQLHTVECEDNVVVRQAPTDPAKTSGIYICGQKLHVDGSPDGNVLTVHGWQNDRPAEVHQEDMALVGPVIVLNQIHNLASVKGRGALSMPTNSDLTGGELKQPEMVVVQWRDEMDFRGASRSAKFIGKVFAQQGESWVLCHTMHVTFDRPIYFNQVQKQSARKPVDPKDPKAARDEKPKIDTVSCFPAPADSVDASHELFVHLNQVERDKNQKIVRWQRLEALEMRIMAQAQDPAGGEKYQSMSALGPGKLRIWQPGDKDFEGPGPNANQPAQPAPMQPLPKRQEQEMKLTFVTFEDRMDAFDKGKVLQQATFTKDVKVINVPTDSPNMKVEGDKLPPRAMLLYCKDKLVVGTHKKGAAPPVQSMEAVGNSYLRTDDYEGWGEKITLEDKLVILTGSETIAARFRNRNNRGTDQPGKKITYDRSTGAFKIIESYGGAIGGPK